MRLKLWGVLALALALVGGTLGCTTPKPHTPVILVHGWGGPLFWAATLTELEAKGYAASDLVVMTYDYVESVTESAKTLAAVVDQVRRDKHADKVDILSHSQGSLVTKQCIIRDACAGRVGHWMSISGVDNGTSVEPLFAIGEPSNEDVQGRTPVIKDLQDNWSLLVGQGVKVEVQYTDTDELVKPADRSCEPAPTACLLVPGASHFTITGLPGVVDETARFFGI